MLAKFDDRLAVQSHELARKWVSGEVQPQASDIEGWSSSQLGTNSNPCLASQEPILKVVAHSCIPGEAHRF